MHDTAMLLWRAQVARVFEGHPWMSCLKNHAQHFPPEALCFERFMQFQFAVSSHLLILLVARLKRFAIEVMQVRRVVRREQRPVTVLKYPFHEQVRYPVGCIHIVGTTSVITGVFTQV